MAKPASYACPNCGAPLVVARNDVTVTCQYCGNAIHVDWAHRHPPAQVQPLTLYASTSGHAGLIALLVALGLLVPIGIGVAVLRAFVSNSNTTDAIQRIAQGIQPSHANFPMVCGINEKLLIADKTFEGTGTLITGEVNCRLTIQNSRLKADVIVLAKNVVEIELIDSILEGNDVAIKTDSNAKIRATGKTTIRGKSAAIDAGLNTEITLTDVRVESPDTAIRANHNLKLEMRGGVIESRDTAIHVKGANPEITLTKGARIVSKTTGIESGPNLKLEMEDASIEAAEVGIDADANAQLDLRAKAKIRGGETALKLATNAEVSLRHASIESERVALCAGYNTTIVARESTIQSKVDALRLAAQPARLELHTSQVTGKQLFHASACTP